MTFQRRTSVSIKNGRVERPDVDAFIGANDGRATDLVLLADGFTSGARNRAKEDVLINTGRNVHLITRPGKDK